MKALNKTSRTLIATLIAGGALLGASSAFAQTVYGQPQMIPVGVSINIGWQPDGRYWDGHHYYSHDDWMHRHPHAHDPYHGHRPPDHHDHG